MAQDNERRSTTIIDFARSYQRTHILAVNERKPLTDVLSKAQRSALMARIAQKNTAPELAIRRALHRLGLRFRLHPRALPGRPDIVFPKHKAALFVNGCFWHGHSCRAGRLPTTNTEYWIPKISGNQARDRRKTDELEKLGWRVFVVWECEIKGDGAQKTASDLAAKIRASEPPVADACHQLSA